MKLEQKIKYYELREQGKTQKEAAEQLEVSDRTCRRWEKEARKELEENHKNAQKAYTAHLKQKNNVLEAYEKLEKAIESIDFEKLSDSQKLEFALKYGRRLDDLDKKRSKLPTDITLTGLEEMTKEESDLFILKTQQKLFNMAAMGEITNEEAQKKIALLSEIRKTVDTTDIF